MIFRQKQSSWNPTPPPHPPPSRPQNSPLRKIFSSDFEYVIPSYQRPYAWTEKEVGALFDDLHDFFQDEREGAYFLGSIVLIKGDSPRAEVIDGQQRLTTLTILLAAIAYRFRDDPELRARVEQYVREPGNPLEGLKAQPRLALRERDREFFAAAVQSFDFEALSKLDAARLPNEAQGHIRDNAVFLLERLDTTFGSDRASLQAFCAFLVTRCYLVVVSTPARRSAFRVFSVLNGRGLDLQHSDRIKADVIGALPEARQDEYTQKWEDIEVRTTRAGLEALLGHIRLIHLRERAKSDLYDEYVKSGGVLDKIAAEARASGRPVSEHLIDEALEPYAEAYRAARSCAYASSDAGCAAAVNVLLRWLNRLDNADWLPCALVFLRQGHRPEDALWFFRKLERLAACLHVRGKNVNGRVRRYAPVLSELLARPEGDGRAPSLELTEEEKREFLSELDGDIYHMTPRRRNYLLLRLDAFLSDGLASYDPERMTIEHVLPQTVRGGSEWARLWPDADQRKEWTHRLANLVILTRIRNSRAQNEDFAKKKTAYFGGGKGVSSFALTSQVLKESEWTPETVVRRQKGLLEALKRGWELEPGLAALPASG